MSYFSFLICDHQVKVDIYVNGLPIGEINKTSGEFLPLVRDKLTGRELTYEELKRERQLPFETSADFKTYLVDLIKAIELKERNE